MRMAQQRLHHREVHTGLGSASGATSDGDGGRPGSDDRTRPSLRPLRACRRLDHRRHAHPPLFGLLAS